MFIGSFDELPDLSFGPGLPDIRSWSSRWFTSVPYVLPFDPAAYRDRARLRGRLGYPQDQPLLVAAVGGTSAGVSLLELTCDAFGRLRKQVPDARMLLVTGPRIDPRLLPDIEGMDKRGYVPDLFEHLACADAAIVQGGLSTTMELVATGRRFIYFPLRRHWEQQHFVTHRLDHYRAGLRMDYTTTTADDLATAMRAALAKANTAPGYRKIPRGGADRAAARIATLLRGEQ
jgi:UDP:flavonoid glycosyltransferase YjiC (YdhE family)